MEEGGDDGEVAVDREWNGVEGTEGCESQHPRRLEIELDCLVAPNLGWLAYLWSRVLRCVAPHASFRNHALTATLLLDVGGRVVEAAGSRFFAYMFSIANLRWIAHGRRVQWRSRQGVRGGRGC